MERNGGQARLGGKLHPGHISIHPDEGSKKLSVRRRRRESKEGVSKGKIWVGP